MYNQVEDTIGYKNVSEPPSFFGSRVAKLKQAPGPGTRLFAPQGVEETLV